MAKGNVTQRGKGAYMLRVDAGTDPLTGKRRQLTRTVHVSGRKPLAQAEQKLREFQAEVDAGRHRPNPNASMSVAQAIETWYTAFSVKVAADDRSPATARKYRQAADTYVLPQLGHLPLASLTSDVLDRFYTDLLTEGRVGTGPGKAGAGEALSAATVRNTHQVLQGVCAMAVRRGWVPTWTKNAHPAAEASPPVVKKRKKTPPTSEQAQGLLAEAKRIDPDWYLYLRLSASVGARRGEVTGLHHSAFDLANLKEARMRIETALTVGPDGVVVETDAPKSEEGFRTVAVDEETAGAIRQAIRAQKERAFACGDRLVADPYLFAETVDGSVPWDPRKVTRRFRYLRNKLGYQGVRLNDLRHYVATQLLGKGVDVITVAGHLGHDPTVTQKVYAEFIPQNSRAAAQIMAGLLDSRSAKTSQHPS